MGATFFDDGCGGAVAVQRIAGQVEDLGALAGRLRYLRFEAVTDDADTVQFDIEGDSDSTLQGMDESGESAGRRETPGQGAGNGVGVLDGQAWQQQQRLGISHAHLRVSP